MDMFRTDRLDLRLSRRAALGATLAVAAASRIGGVAARETAPATPVAGEHFEIRGDVANPGTWTVAGLQALPAESVDLTYRTDTGEQVRHTYTGVRFWDVLQMAQPKLDPSLPVASLHGYVVLTARDGYVVVISLGEIDPEFGARPYLLAWAEDGQPLAGDRSPVVLVTPGDVSEGRYIHGIVTIDVRTVDTATCA